MRQPAASDPQDRTYCPNSSGCFASRDARRVRTSRRRSGASFPGFRSRASASPRYRRGCAPAWACVRSTRAGSSRKIGEGHVMTILIREALAGARRRLRDGLGAGSCPACEAVAFGAQRARQMIVDGLNDPALARLYSGHGGICLVHFLDAAPVLEPAALTRLSERLLRSLVESENSELVALLGGVDRDAHRRGPVARPPSRAIARELDPRPCLRSVRYRCVPRLSTDRGGGMRLRPLGRRAHRA